MENVFLALWETNEKMYLDLRDRVIGELDCDLNRYRIQVGVAEKNSFDPSHHLMAPVCEEDLDCPAFRAGELREKIAEEGAACLATVLVRGTPGELESFLAHPESYSGRLKGRDRTRGCPVPGTVPEVSWAAGAPVPSVYEKRGALADRQRALFF